MTTCSVFQELESDEMATLFGLSCFLADSSVAVSCWIDTIADDEIGDEA